MHDEEMIMKLAIVTIVLDGMPFLPMQLACFNRLRCDWHWYISHGAADNTHDTAWCKKQHPRLSSDGSTKFLAELRGHPRISIYEKPLWDGKTEMVNAGLPNITEPCVLMQIDVDELWTPEQIDTIVEVFENDGRGKASEMRFFCRYFVGPNIVTVGENCYGNNPGEWIRVWRFEPGMRFLKHEPPVMNHITDGCSVPREDTRNGWKGCEGVVFDHWAYVFESQVAYKERFYGYTDAVKHWKRLQAHPGPWPVKLADFLPWCDQRAQADRLHK
jgi:hypothetical protein